jgi:hypothetical protein
MKILAFLRDIIHERKYMENLCTCFYVDFPIFLETKNHNLLLVFHTRLHSEILIFPKKKLKIF